MIQRDSVQPQGFNLPLEGLRGLACLLVAFSHLFYTNFLDPSITLPAWLKTIEGGHYGVMIFFMLSGFVIGWTNPQSCNRENVVRYCWRRIVRLAPIYYLALLLTLLVTLSVQGGAQARVFIGAALWLQNLNDYFSFKLPPPSYNHALWSLHYEMIYYGAFILLWFFRPALRWVFLPALVVGMLSWFTPQVMPIFLGSYACGWIVWATGWWLAKQSSLPSAPAIAPVLTWLLLGYAEHRLGGIFRIFNFLGWHSADSGVVSLAHLGMVPAIALLLADVARRQLPGRKTWIVAAWAICLVPLAGMLWTTKLWTNASWISGAVALGLAAACTGFRSLDWLSRFAGLGRISYAFYLVHFPLIFAVQSLPLPAGNLSTYALRIAVWAAIAFPLAWLLESRFQPWIKNRLLARPS